LFRTIKKGRFFYVGDGETLRHPIYISDMMTGFDLAAKFEGEPGEVFILAGKDPSTLKRLANTIADTLGVKRPSIKLPKSLVWIGVAGLEIISNITGKSVPFTRRSLKFYTGNTAFSIKKAQSQLDFDPLVDLESGVSQTAKWLVENNRL
jgi:nucleoside-diphosphate-sugar epimerase